MIQVNFIMIYIISTKYDDEKFKASKRLKKSEENIIKDVRNLFRLKTKLMTAQLKK